MQMFDDVEKDGAAMPKTAAGSHQNQLRQMKSRAKSLTGGIHSEADMDVNGPSSSHPSITSREQQPSRGNKRKSNEIEEIIFASPSAWRKDVAASTSLSPGLGAVPLRQIDIRSERKAFMSHKVCVCVCDLLILNGLDTRIWSQAHS